MALNSIGLWRIRRITGHDRRIYNLMWDNTGDFLLSSSEDKTFRVWHAPTGKPAVKPIQSTTTRIVAWSPEGRLVATNSALNELDVRVRNMQRNNIVWEGANIHDDRITCLAWSPNGKLLATASADYTVKIWEFRTRDLINVIDHPAPVTALAWSPDGEYIATGTSYGFDNNVRVFTTRRRVNITTLTGHNGGITALAWSPDGRTLASGSTDRTVRVWEMDSASFSKLESHSGTIISLSFSHDGSLLASKGMDETFRLWSAKKDGYVLVHIERESGSNYEPSALAFNPKLPRLATLNDDGTVIEVWEYDERIHDAKPELPLVYYSNAKVVLVGDGSAGKTCLGQALVKLPFVPSEGTHGMNVWTLHEDNSHERNGWGVRQEILLWDLAGQENYRLVHQLYLKDISLVLLVFNGSAVEPLKGIRYWNRALNFVQNTQTEEKAPEVPKLLVEARIDQGGSNVSQQYIKQLVKDESFAGYYRTSALNKDGIEELREKIISLIHWDELEAVVSTQFFQVIQDFLKERHESSEHNGRSNTKLAASHVLFRQFLESDMLPDLDTVIDLRAQFETCIGFLESMGLMRRFKFGRLVLLQPDLLNYYASAIINAAKDENLDGFGRLNERRVMKADFPIQMSGRLMNSDEEKWMLIATVDDLLSHEVALRDDGYLIFPSQFVQEYHEIITQPGEPEIGFTFAGAVTNIYAIIVVRLARSDEFEMRSLSHHNVQFVDRSSRVCGLELRTVSTDDSKGEMFLYFEKHTSQITRYRFEMFINALLREMAQPGSIGRRRFQACTNCQIPLGDRQIQARLDLGHQWITCPVCETRVPLGDPPITVEMQRDLLVSMQKMSRSATVQKNKEVARWNLESKRASGNFDVLMLYNRSNVNDLTMVTEVMGHLAERGIYCWDEYSISFEEGKSLINNVKSAALFIGADGLGNVDMNEVLDFFELTTSVGLAVAVVLLPNANNIPPEVLEYRQGVRDVYFFRQINEINAMDELEEIITGVNPR